VESEVEFLGAAGTVEVAAAGAGAVVLIGEATFPEAVADLAPVAAVGFEGEGEVAERFGRFPRL
jgi:hypothetical protein